MVNNTVKTGKAAGKGEPTQVTVASTTANNKGEIIAGNDMRYKQVFGKDGIDGNRAAYISITAYDGGNPNKKQNKKEGTGRSE